MSKEELPTSIEALQAMVMELADTVKEQQDHLAQSKRCIATLEQQSVELSTTVEEQ